MAKHILWSLVILIIAILAFGPVWIAEYDVYKRNQAESSYTIVPLPDDYFDTPNATPTPGYRT